MYIFVVTRWGSTGFILGMLLRGGGGGEFLKHSLTMKFSPSFQFPSNVLVYMYHFIIFVFLTLRTIIITSVVVVVVVVVIVVAAAAVIVFSLQGDMHASSRILTANKIHN
jgi:hypothetical protein